MLVVDGVTDRTATTANRLQGEAVAVVPCGLDLQGPQTDLNRTGVTAASAETGFCAAGLGFGDHGAGLATATADGLEQDGRAGFAAGEHREVAALARAEGDAAAITTDAAIAAHRGAHHRGIGGIGAISGVDHGASGAAAAADALDQHADGLITTGDHIAGDGTRGTAANAAVATGAVIAVIQGEAKAVGRINAAAAGPCHGRGISCDRSALATTAAHRLEQEAVGVVACGDDRAVDVGRHLTALTTIATGASHAEAG